MNDPDNPLNDSSEFDQSRFPWPVILIAVVLFGGAAAWIWHDKSENRSRQAVIDVLEKELDIDQAALDVQKQKVVQLTQQLEVLKAQIQNHEVKDGKQAVADYNKLASDQRSEREKWIGMANQYNEKVARLHKLQ